MSLQITAGTTITFGGEVGDDVAMSSEAIATGAGRQSAASTTEIGDPASGRTNTYLAEAINQWQATPTVGQETRWYINPKIGDDSQYTSDDGTTDIAISSEDKIKNSDFLGAVVCDEAAANIPTGKNFGLVEINQQHIIAQMWNDSGATTTADDSENKLFLTPYTFADV